MNINNRWFQLVRVADRDDHDRQPAVRVDAVRRADAGGDGWKLSDIQWAFTLFILFQTWVQPLDGWLIDRLGPRCFITRGRRAVRARLGRHGLRDVAADALHAVCAWPASARRSSTAARSARR